MSRIIYFRLGDRDRISFNNLVRYLRNILGMLEDLDATVSESKSGSVRWEVAVLRKDSPPLLGIEGHPASQKVEDKFPLIRQELFAGLRTLAESPERDRYYSDSLLGRIRTLASDSRHSGPVKVYTDDEEVNRQEVSITGPTFKNIEQIIGVKYRGLASVVGSLDAISVHKKNEFRIWDENTGKPVTCVFGVERLDDVKSFLRAKVSVYGEVRSNQRGEPISILVQDIESRTPQSLLPTIEQMSGLVEDMYGGKTLKEHLEDIRND